MLRRCQRRGMHLDAPHCKYPPLSQQRWVLFPLNFGTLVLLSQGAGQLSCSSNNGISSRCSSCCDKDKRGLWGVWRDRALRRRGFLLVKGVSVTFLDFGVALAWGGGGADFVEQVLC